MGKAKSKKEMVVELLNTTNDSFDLIALKANVTLEYVQRLFKRLTEPA